MIHVKNCMKTALRFASAPNVTSASPWTKWHEEVAPIRFWIDALNAHFQLVPLVVDDVLSRMVWYARKIRWYLFRMESHARNGTASKQWTDKHVVERTKDGLF